MDMDEYQKLAGQTAVHPGEHEFIGLAYCGLKLNGEAGEVAEHIGKALRDDGGVISPEREVEIAQELGDCLWYVARLAHLLPSKLTLSSIAEMNIHKLQDRKKRGVLKGSGSNR
jgi:NTP pyrophosphatase (non-canonical NTP hydrolase)